ncbi:MAG: flavin reductase family protein [Candidatus Omnitrophica bacterium]|nr:flavin reductase family protein [Candidatus Omnitrophota bacterium]
MKIEVPKEKALRFINSGNLILVTSAYKDKTDIVTVAWHSPLCRKPPLTGISIAKSHLTCEFIGKSGEFIINIPGEPLLKETVLCGSVSGREREKFSEAGLTPVKAKRLVRTPVIGECAGHIECYVRDTKEYGDHILFSGEVIYAEAEEGIFREYWDTDGIKLIYHLGGSRFTTSGKTVDMRL